MLATPECFAHLTQLLQVLAGGRVCAVLEVTAARGRAPRPEAGMPSEVAAARGGAPAWGPDPPALSCFCFLLFPGRLPPGVPLPVCVHDGASAAGRPCPALVRAHGAPWQVRGREEGGWEGPGWEAGPHYPASPCSALESLQCVRAAQAPHWVSLQQQGQPDLGWQVGWRLRLL